MKLRKQSSRRKWRNRFYRLQAAAATNTVTRELLRQPHGDAFARQAVSDALDNWIAHTAIGEIGPRVIDYSNEGFWHSDLVLFRASTMAKRPYHVRHWRAKAARDVARQKVVK